MPTTTLTASFTNLKECSFVVRRTRKNSIRVLKMISDIRRNSDAYEKINGGDLEKQRNLEKNCNQIFAKGPALTKDFLEKVQHDIGAETTQIFGYEMKSKQFWLIAGLFLLFTFSFTGTIIMWFTSLFDKSIFSQLVIKNGSDAYQYWTHVLPKPLLKIYLFNYTNVESYESRLDTKLTIHEVGPYVYEQQVDRVNAVFHADNTISYQQKNTFKFRPDLSHGRQSDLINIPNIPVFAGAASVQNKGFIERLAFNGMLKTLTERPFVKKTAHRLIVGYENDYYDITKKIYKLQTRKDVLSENFGLLAAKSGIQKDVYTINSGSSNINKLNIIEKINNKTGFEHWSTDECNSYYGSDGSMYPPKIIREKQPVYVVPKEMCRKLPMVFDREEKILDGKIPAYRYKLPINFMDTPDDNPLNQCYCNMDSGDCPLKGLFNATPCSAEAPLFYSFPHFFNADESLKKPFRGIKEKKPEDVEGYTYFHPTLGYAIAASLKLQVNVQVKKSFGVSELSMFDDGMILPVFWFEMTLEEQRLPDEFISIVYQTTFTIKGVELGLKYGSVLVAIVTLISICIVLKSKLQSRKRTSSIRPLQRRNGSIEEDYS